MFVVNIVKSGTPRVRRTMHLPECKYAGRSRRHYQADRTEALRLLTSLVRGNDRLTVFCRHCKPLTEIEGR